MTRNREREIKRLVDDLMTRTTWPMVGQPAASTFSLAKKDLEIIKPYSAEDYKGPKQIAVRHRVCGCKIEYWAHPTDSIFSKYYCIRADDLGYRYRGCDWELEVRDLQRLTLNELQRHCYTELVEDPAELMDWPIKFCEVDTGKIRYTSTRPLTREELLRKRVERLMQIRSEHG
jgi:hypothetical protein